MMSHHEHDPDGPRPAPRRRPWPLVIFLVALVAVGGALYGYSAATDDVEVDTDRLADELAGADTASASDGQDYPLFDHVDVATSPYFAQVEPTGAVEELDELGVYRAGVTACRRLDDGWAVRELLANGVEVYGDRVDYGTLVGAAVNHLCPHHHTTVEQAGY